MFVYKKMKHKVEFFLYTFVMSGALLVLLSGCVAPPSPERAIASGHYREAALTVVSEKNANTHLDVKHLLPTLQAGNLFLYAQDYKNSLKMFNEAEQIVKVQNEALLLGSAGDMLSRLLLNDAMVDYHATTTDAVMINTYKALDYMVLGERANARVELNRAIDRQRRAKERYSELITKQKEAMAQKERQEQGNIDLQQTLNSSELSNVMKNQQNITKEFQAYPDFINPFTTYLAGLYFLLEGDYSKAYSLLKEVRGMMANNITVRSDFEILKRAQKRGQIDDHYVWVIYENGLAPIRKEMRINIPMFIFTDKIAYTGIALPRMQQRTRATENLALLSHGKKLAETDLISDMDRVILSEFGYVYPEIVTRAVFSALIKTYFQYRMNKKDSYAGLAAAIFQMATTRADTRTWTSLPKEFQVARVKMPSDHKLSLHSGVQKIEVKINPNAKQAIVYVKISTATSIPSYSVIYF